MITQSTATKPPDRADAGPPAVIVPLDVLRRLPVARRSIRATTPRNWAPWEQEALALIRAGLNPKDAARLALQVAA
ncbi:hypothetical protein [Frankia sp. AvcI1]|uniref:hypothetical protein n=1 Tax=Frankia sp. AvcI1 TaxID=573496 RepID=UPI0012FE3B6E|nr:hypothetical protein [Frankia sp. AvcI1]